MKTTIAVKPLVAALNTACRCVNKHTSLPILGNALVETHATDNKVRIVTTDLDNTQIVTLELDRAYGAGQVTVPVHRLAGTVKLCKGAVELETVEQTLAVRNGSNFVIPTLPVEDFPPLPVLKKPHCVQIPAGPLRQAIARVEACQGTDGTRYILQSILFEFQADGLYMIATDGRRLASQFVNCFTGHLDFNHEKPRLHSVVVHSETISLLKAALGKEPKKFNAAECVSVALEWESHEEFAGKGNPGDADYQPPMPGPILSFSLHRDGQAVQIIGKIVDGQYPNYRQVIPTQSKERVTLPVDEFAQAVKVAEMATTEAQKSVKLTFNAAGVQPNVLTVSGKSSEKGESSATVPVNYSFAEFSIAFNPCYLADAVSSIKGQTDVVFEWQDELSPGVFKTVDGDWLYVLMPMRLA